jgi:hypothetical protein
VNIPHPEDDLFSDAMDSAVSWYHSVRHGATRNAERCGETIDGEKLARRALAAGIFAHLSELGFTLTRSNSCGCRGADRDDGLHEASCPQASGGAVE